MWHKNTNRWDRREPTQTLVSLSQRCRPHLTGLGGVQWGSFHNTLTHDLYKCVRRTHHSINHKRKPESYWYKKLPLAIQKVDGMMNLAKDCSPTGKKPTILLERRQVQTLCAANVADSTVMKLSDHFKAWNTTRDHLFSRRRECHFSSAIIVYCHLLSSYHLQLLQQLNHQ